MLVVQSMIISQLVYPFSLSFVRINVDHNEISLTILLIIVEIHLILILFEHNVHRIKNIQTKEYKNHTNVFHNCLNFESDRLFYQG
jgi:hypothetical protein